MKLWKNAGATSNILQIFIRDVTAQDGSGLTGLTNASSGLTAYYHRDTDTTATAISLVTMTVGTFTSSGFKEIDATNMPGWYQFCPPDAAMASGAKSVGLHLKGATNMAPVPIECQLTAVDPDSATAFVTSVVAASVTGAVGSVTGNVGGNVTGSVGSVVGAVGSVTGLTASDVGAIKTKTDFLPSATAGAAGGVFIAGTNAATTVTTSFTTTFTGNLTGSVGSVSGAVGSVSGNVGGNVTGSVGSVAGNVGGNVVGSVGSVTGLTAANLDVAVSTRLAAGSYAVPPTANENADALLDRSAGVETGITPRQWFRLAAAALFGKASGLATTTAVYRDTGDNKDRISATVDADGNRTAVTLDAS